MDLVVGVYIYSVVLMWKNIVIILVAVVLFFI